MSQRSSGYEPRWDRDFADGYAGELFTQWAEEAIREGAAVEVKTDRESWTTGNVYIEERCWKSGQWVPSGIDAVHTKSLLWAHIVAGPIVIFAPTAFVKRAAERYGKPCECRDGGNPTKGKRLPIQQFTAALVGIAKAWATPGIGEPVVLPGEGSDPEAPFGRDFRNQPLAPWGHNKDGRVRLVPGGRRAERRSPDGLWPADGAA